MKRLIFIVTLLLAFAPLSFARDNNDNGKDERERLQSAGDVMHDVLNISEDVPRDLLDKAPCVIVMPSVIKGAFIVGGSYGHGTMVCRSGKDFSGPWGKPAMMALEGGSIGFQIGGQATDYVFLVMNNRGVDSLLHSKVKLSADRLRCGRPGGPHRVRGHRRGVPRRNPHLFTVAGSICRGLA